VRISILEDDPDQLALLKRWISEDGHDVHAYQNSREAMKHAGRESFDLFADWRISGSGAEFLPHPNETSACIATHSSPSAIRRRRRIGRGRRRLW
jgi:DNA-binding NtrC family response regulator